MKFGIGQSVPRKEDPRLLTGGGEFTDDVNLPDQVYLRIFRSPYAHGRLTALDIQQALTLEGVLRIFTAGDLKQLGSLPCRAVLTDASGEPAFVPRRPILAEDRICFVGQAIAGVVATSPEIAQQAVDLITVDIDDLVANVDPAAALDPNTPVIHAGRDTNLCVHYERGDADAVGQAMQQATHRVEVNLVNNRVAPTPMEPRASLGYFDKQKNQYVLYNPSQGPVAQQGVLANAIFNVPVEQVRVISLDTGGGFGIRGEVHPEACLVLHAARELGVPVKFTGDRSEMFLADTHGRDNITRVTGAFDAEGLFLGLRVETTANLGAYCNAVGPFVPTVAGGRVVGTVYRIPAVYHSVQTVFTNTMPVGAYRGAGRPEACYVMERLMDAAARQLDMDAITLRKLNFIQPAQMPYLMPSGVELTGGHFSETLDLCVSVSDWPGYRRRMQNSASRGLLRGRGIGYYVESSGGVPEEEARILVNEDGSVDVTVGTFSHGQGHRTTFSQIISEQLDIPFDQINIIQGDTSQVKFGGGTGGSRSSQMGGVAVGAACRHMLADAREIAGELLQSPTESISYAGGEFSSSRTGSAVSLARVAQAAGTPQFGGLGLTRTHRYNRGSGYTFPNGCHIAEVEIDRETGVVTLDRYVAVDDCGRVINPLLAAGQVHGGVVQGVGQTIFEQITYNGDGQLLSGTLMDYAMPRASQVPDVQVHFNEVPDPNNELGVKGIGEGGACGAPPAIVNAVLDALSLLGVTTIDMPLTPETVWRTLQNR